MNEPTPILLRRGDATATVSPLGAEWRAWRVDESVWLDALPVLRRSASMFCRRRDTPPMRVWAGVEGALGQRNAGRVAPP